MKRALLTFVLLASFTALPAQEAGTSAKSAESKEVIKKGFSFGGIPIVAFDQDKGFQYGLMCNIYDFGKGEWYPNPRQQVYLEASWFTKGSQLYTLTYDNRFLIPGVRFSFAAQFINDKGLDFFGFNGYQSYYDASLPSAYYRMSRKLPVGKIDFTGTITKHLYWKFGYQFKYFILDEFEDAEGKLAEMPYQFSLYKWYQELGLICADEAHGGMSSAWRAGLMYDSRDVENSPSKGIWAEASFEYAPAWMGTNKPYGKYYAAFRHYVPIPNDRLVFAMRGNIQGYTGTPAFYMLPFDSVIGPSYDKDGFGGYRTVRGVMRNRIQGRSVCYFNTELRWKFINFTVAKQNISLGLNAFLDGGKVLQEYETGWNSIDQLSPVVPDQLRNFGKNAEAFHLAAGAGFRFIMNKNFIIAVEYGKPFNSQDNAKGAFYVNTGYLF